MQKEVVSTVQYDPQETKKIVIRQAHVHYRVSNLKVSKKQRGTLVDRGANGGILGDDAHVIFQHNNQVDVTGIDNHEMTNLKLVDGSATAITQKGLVIIRLCQYAYYGVGRSIHSAGQIEHYKNHVDEKSRMVGGQQVIISHDGYMFPLDVTNGLPYLKMRPNTQEEWETLPHVFFTSSEEWDPTVLDCNFSEDENWFTKVQPHPNEGLPDDSFDERGEYRHREPTLPPKKEFPDHKQEKLKSLEQDSNKVAVYKAESRDDNDLDDYNDDSNYNIRECYFAASNLNERYVCLDHEVGMNDSYDIECYNVELNEKKQRKKKEPDYERLRPYFNFVPVEKIRKTFECTTQYAANVVSGLHLYQTIKSPYPANNVKRRHEPVAVDIIFAECPAIEDGSTMAAFYVGRKSLVCDIFGMTREAQFINTFLDCIKKRGAMDILVSDSARSLQSKRVEEVQRALHILSHQSERDYQHQNFAEHQYNHIKRYYNFYSNWRNVWPSAWLLLMQWICRIHEATAQKSLGWRTPLEVATGVTPDISIMMCFLFWDVVYCARHKEKDYTKQVGSLKSNEIRGYFVGFAENVGHALTFKILTCDTKKIIHRSVVRLGHNEPYNNLRIPETMACNNLKTDIEAGAKLDRELVRSLRQEGQPMPTIDIRTDPISVVENDGKVLSGGEVQESRGFDSDIPQGTVKTTEEVRDEIPQDQEGQKNLLKENGEKGSGESREVRSTDERNQEEEPSTDRPSQEIPSSGNLKPTVSDQQPTPTVPNWINEDDPKLKQEQDVSTIEAEDPPRRTTGRHRTQTPQFNVSTTKGQVYKSESKKATSIPVIPEVETVEDDDELLEGYTTQMGKPPMKDLPEQPLESMWHDPEDRPKQLDPKNKPGRKHHNNEPLDFSTHPLKTERKTIKTKDMTPEDLIGRSFLMPEEDDGTRDRAVVTQLLTDFRKDVINKTKDHPEVIKLKCLVKGEYEEIVAYNDICDYIEEDDGWEGEWKFEEILDHEGPLKPGDKRYMGCKYNFLTRWGDSTQSWRPLHGTDKDGNKCGIADGDATAVAIYCRKHGLLGKPGIKSPKLMRLAKTAERLRRRANQAKLHSFRNKPVYMYGHLAPRNYAQAMELDQRNGNDKWKIATKLELDQIIDYKTFEDKGVGYRPGPDYKKIRVHLVYAVKHDGRHKARLVAGGHLTETPIDSVYSSVVSLRGIRYLTFIAELNDLEVWCTDIGNAYLESLTKEKVYIIAGDEFGELKGHTLIIVKALYGLKSSGLRWHERLADVLREMGFIPSRFEPDIWMRDKGDHYEYIAVYVDDLTIVGKDNKSIIDALLNDYNFKLKGTGSISFLLGCDFFRDDDGVLCYAPRKYIEKMLDNYQRIFGQMPKKATSPLVKGDHPELDSSDLLDFEDIKIYQSLIGAMQWVIQIGRWDITTAVMTLSRFRAAPRQGHLDRIKRIYGYLLRFRNGVVRVDTNEPDYSGIPNKVFDWEHTCYGGAKEEIPMDAPEPKGKPVVMTTCVDANLMHDLISGRSVTGIIHFFNNTVVDWFSKLQSTVETATFGSEFVATRTAVDQICAARLALRYLGVPIKGSSVMFGDNQSVVTNSTLPHSALSRRHTALSYHRTREAIASKMLRYHFIEGPTNPADLLSKHWDHASVWDTLKPLMFYNGED